MYESSLKSLKFIYRGKVRDLYEIDEQHMLMIATDRLSAFDVILPTPIPDKGKILTAISNFWFGKLSAIVPNHLTGIDPTTVVAANERDQVAGRAVVVKRLQALPIEAIKRLARFAASSCPQDCSALRSCHSPSSHRQPKPQWATTMRTSHLTRLKS
jgi:phosphoribosylaminoimidazole-succinocarboxamide synthase